MSYFRELPNIAYQSPLLDKNSSRDYISNQSKSFNPESKDLDIDLFNKLYNENKFRYQ